MNTKKLYDLIKIQINLIKKKKNQSLFLGSHRIVITLKINSVGLHKLVFSFVIIKIN